jgi:hypothetical protein
MGVAEMGSYAGTSNEIGTSDCEIRYFEPINPRFVARCRNLVEPEQFKIADGLRQPSSMGLVANGLEQSTWHGGAMGFRNGALIRVEGLQRNRVLSILAERLVRRGTAYREREKCAHPVVFLEGARPTLRAVVGLWEALRSRTAKEKA